MYAPPSILACPPVNKPLIRVFIVDDHPIVSDLFSDMLNRSGDFTAIGTAADGETALKKLENLPVDIVILDLILPGMGGLELVDLLRANRPKAKLVICSGLGSDRAIVEAYARGVNAYVEKSGDVEELFSTLRIVAEGKYLLNTRISGLLGDFVRQSNILKPIAAGDMHILRQLAAGRTLKQIAKELEISVSGVYKSRARIRARMNIKGPGGFLDVALSLGLVYPTVAGLPNAARPPIGQEEGAISS